MSEEASKEKLDPETEAGGEGGTTGDFDIERSVVFATLEVSAVQRLSFILHVQGWEGRGVRGLSCQMRA
jgi:hypothetical protein